MAAHASTAFALKMRGSKFGWIPCSEHVRLTSNAKHWRKSKIDQTGKRDRIANVTKPDGYTENQSFPWRNKSSKHSWIVQR